MAILYDSQVHRRNLLSNGNFTVDQLGIGPYSDDYLCDMWQGRGVGNVGASVSAEIVNDDTEDSYLSVTIGSGATGSWYMGNASLVNNHLRKSGYYTFSIKVKSDTTAASYRLQLYIATTSGLNTDHFVAFDPFDSGGGRYEGTVYIPWETFAYDSSNYYSFLRLETIGVALPGTIEVNNIQFEKSKVATEIEALGKDADIFDCMRFIQKFAGIRATDGFASGYWYSATQCLFPLKFHRRFFMRPTAVSYSSQTGFFCAYITASPTTTAITNANSTVYNMRILCTVASGGAADSPSVLYPATASDYIFITAYPGT